MDNNLDSPKYLTTNGYPAVERRRDPRFSFCADAEVVEVVSGACLRMNARVADLSMGGCYLDTRNPFAPGTRTHVGIRVANSNFTCVATVKSSQPGMGMGVAFEPLTQAQTDLLHSWIHNASSNFEFDTERGYVPGNSTHPDANPAPEDLSLRLAKLLLRKGLLDQADLSQLLSPNRQTKDLR
jgi:hypothetical protein